MSIPRYQEGERVRFLAEGTVAYVRHAPCEAPHPGALTIAVPLEGGGTYDVTVPLLDTVTVERLVPVEGKPRPGEIWADAAGAERFAYKYQDSPSAPVFLQGADGTASPWQNIHNDAQLGPITRVYPPAPAPDTTGGQAETPDALHNALHDAIERTIEDNYADTTGGYLVAPWAVAALAARAAMAVLETRAEEADRG